MAQLVKKAVFPVAGWGTRFLPATKAMPKELLPILNKPLIQFAAEEAVEAGIETLIFVTGRNKRAIEDHFDKNWELENALIEKNQLDNARLINSILPSKVECVFVRQTEQLGLGHAVLCAERVVGNEPFAVLLADEFLVGNKLGATSELVLAFEKALISQILYVPLDGPIIENYGVIKKKQYSNQVERLIEKPSFSDAPSNLASIGRYILTPDVFNKIKASSVGSTGEIQLSDALDKLAIENKVACLKFEGNRFDCGSVSGFVKAINFEADRQKIFKKPDA